LYAVESKMPVFTLLSREDFMKGGRRKRGGDPDQAPVSEPTLDIDLPEEEVDVDPEKKATLRALVLGSIRKSLDVMHAALTSETAKNTAVLAITITTSLGVLAAADQQYGGDICSPRMAQLASAMAGVGLTGNQIKCAAAQKAYEDTFALLKPLVISAIGAATGRLIGLKLSIGEGFITSAMNKVIAGMQATPDAPAETAPAPTTKARKGGRTKRSGSKKSRKSRKSRR
jgi:hypothetical protein